MCDIPICDIIKLPQVSVAAGAIIAGASKADVAALEEFAEKIGLAFQSESMIVFVFLFTRCAGRYT